MNRLNEPFLATRDVHQSAAAFNAIRGPCAEDVCVIYLEGVFRAPLTGKLRHDVLSLLRGGARTIVLDLARVSKIDAAGIGQLVRAYNVTVAAGGVLQITRATALVREVLQLVGLFRLLSAGRASTKAS